MLLTLSHLRFLGVLTSAMALAACRPAARPQIETITSMPIVHELPLPRCSPGAPASFLRRHDAAHPFAGPAATWGRLHLRVVSADPADSVVGDPAVTLASRGLVRSPRRLGPGIYESDSLAAGAVSLSIRAILYQSLRETVRVRAGYVDTLVAGLMRACRPPI